MGEIVNSICLHENNMSWVQAEVESGQSIGIKKVVESPLPFVINYDNIQKSTTALRIANHLNSLADTNELTTDKLRFVLSTKFGITKKITLDETIAPNLYSEIVKNELSYIITTDADDYLIYQPDFIRERNSIKELLAVAIRKDLFSFFQQVGQEAHFSLQRISLNCFSIDELYRRFFPNLIGQSLLVNFTERGFEMVVSDEQNFLDFNFKPYTPFLQDIEQLSENEVFSAFSAGVDEIQKPGVAESSMYSISQIFLFGTYFKSHWLNKLQKQSKIPLRVLNPTDTTEWQVISDDPKFNSSEAYRFVEPLSNIF